MGRLVAVWGLIALQAALWPASVHAKNPDDLSLTVTIVPQGPPADITDLVAAPGGVDGMVHITWTEPGEDGWLGTASTYTIRVSTIANIESNADFNDSALARPLSYFSPSIIAPPGPGGSLRTETIIGLTPSVTYYFAIRTTDHEAPAKNSDWSRAGGLNPANFVVAPDFVPQMPHNLNALSSSGSVKLTWDSNVEPDISFYVVYRDTNEVASDAGFVWYTTTSLTTFTDTGLMNRVTYYYRIAAADTPPNVLYSPLTPWATGFPDSVRVAEFGATSRQRRVYLGWQDLPPTTKTGSFVSYKIYRSTQNQPGTVLISTTSSTVAIDTAVIVGSTYYYQATAEIAPGTELERSSIVAVYVRSSPPLSPLGLGLAVTTNSMTLEWASVKNFEDWQYFAVSTAPVPDELNGYRVYRATQPAGASWALVASLSTATLSVTVSNPSAQDYYQVCSVNAGDMSRRYLVRSVATRNAFVVAPDEQSTLEIPAATADALFSPAGASYQIMSSSHPEDLGGRVVKSVAFTPVRDGITLAASAMAMSSKVKVHLRYDLQNGVVRASGVGAAAAVSPDQMSIYWNNGSRWVQVYGTNDALAQALTVETSNLGRYQLRSVERTAGFTFNAAGISNRMITPNGDGMNDVVIFTFDNPRDSQVSGKIFDLKGAEVTTMVPGPASGTLMWDGKAGGGSVPGGVYIYQIEAEGQAFNGTVVVIK
ncbi:MAG: gliding motility-associated C-terminal domain-containing protein [Elusimicrobiota bacterium]|jgi:fibronectin type 3 domain-containing protein